MRCDGCADTVLELGKLNNSDMLLRGSATGFWETWRGAPFDPLYDHCGIDYLSGQLARVKRLQTMLAASSVVSILSCAVSYFFRSDAFSLPGVQDGIRRLGWPLVIWEQGGFAYRHTFNIAALLADLAVAVIAGALISVLYARVIHKPSA